MIVGRRHAFADQVTVTTLLTWCIGVGMPTPYSYIGRIVERAAAIGSGPYVFCITG